MQGISLLREREGGVPLAPVTPSGALPCYWSVMFIGI